MIRHNKFRDDPRVFVLSMSDSDKKRSARINLAFVAGITVFQFLAGMVNQDSSRTVWIVFLYLFTFLPLIYAFFGVFIYWEAGLRMSSLQYEHGLMRIRRSLLAVLVMDLLGIVLELFYILRCSGNVAWLPELIYIALHLPQAVLVVCYGRYYDRTYAAKVREEEMK